MKQHPRDGNQRLERTCFVAQPMGEDSETRKTSDQVFSYIIKPALTENDYAAVRADQISDAGMISEEVVRHLIDSPLVIADITGHNPNVMYELGIRQAINKPLILISQERTRIPFDISALRVIFYDIRFIESMNRATQILKEQIRLIQKEKIPEEGALDKKLIGRLAKQDADAINELKSTVSESSEQYRGPSPHIMTDSWTVDDFLGYRLYAHAIARFIVHPKTTKPVCMGIQAPWGQGKSEELFFLIVFL